MEECHLLDIENTRLRIYSDRYDFSVIRLWRSELIQLWALCALTLAFSIGATSSLYMLLQGGVASLFLFMYYKKHIQYATILKKDIRHIELNEDVCKLVFVFIAANGKEKKCWLRLPRKKEKVARLKEALLFFGVSV